MDKLWAFDQFIEELESNYRKGLPGKPGQLLMKPYVGISKNIDVPPTPSARKGAVLALFYPVDNIPHLALMLRPDYDGVHGGQISFPGGKVELDDKSPMHAALREANEEVGVISDHVNIIGPVTEVFVLASNFLVLPFIGYTESRPHFVIDRREVEELIEIPFSYLMNDKIIKQKKIRSKAGFDLNAPYFDINGKVLWGATAMMINEIITLAKGDHL